MVRSHPVAAAFLHPYPGPEESGAFARVGLAVGPGRRAMFAVDAHEAGLGPWTSKVPGTNALVSLPAWVVLLRDALVNVKAGPVGFTHWVLSRAGELPRQSRDAFASSVDSLVRLDPRAHRAVTELLDMMSSEGRGEIGEPSE